MNADVIVSSFHPIDFVHAEKKDAAAGPNHKSGEIFLARLKVVEQSGDALVPVAPARVTKLLLGATQGGLEALPVERFQQIVEGINFECSHRVLIMSRNKNNGRHLDRSPGDGFDHTEAVYFRHLHIQKNEIGFDVFDS